MWIMNFNILYFIDCENICNYILMCFKNAITCRYFSLKNSFK